MEVLGTCHLMNMSRSKHHSFFILLQFLNGLLSCFVLLTEPLEEAIATAYSLIFLKVMYSRGNPWLIRTSIPTFFLLKLFYL